MKILLKIFLTLMLSVTILYPSLSQVTYVIEGKEVVCYTRDENRELAIIIAEKLKCQDISIIKDSLLFIKDERILELKNEYKKLDNLFVKRTELSERQLKEIDYLSTTANKLNARLNRSREINRFILGSGAMLLLFILIIE